VTSKPVSSSLDASLTLSKSISSTSSYRDSKIKLLVYTVFPMVRSVRQVSNISSQNYITNYTFACCISLLLYVCVFAIIDQFDY